ncbi:hypothetical protein PFICI_00499 [Pestalotiopsis fici W106-1]|uniref:Uncharacterized protein n=1 Tax=Pestalotiopsis fici (strain W106-1 / CGMCC3.15140) TaxID=1229662 RepID=W3XN16_PESFW|nr:uncharacterized protein PFICI_00499 [Pestalotiopsis fici W106-1]ETS86671.1 hypothetical protein PFICI_00499 [Pestalotiopsis fici W106-1]
MSTPDLMTIFRNRAEVGRLYSIHARLGLRFMFIGGDSDDKILWLRVSTRTRYGMGMVTSVEFNQLLDYYQQAADDVKDPEGDPQLREMIIRLACLNADACQRANERGSFTCTSQACHSTPYEESLEDSVEESVEDSAEGSDDDSDEESDEEALDPVQMSRIAYERAKGFEDDDEFFYYTPVNTAKTTQEYGGGNDMEIGEETDRDD